MTTVERLVRAAQRAREATAALELLSEGRTANLQGDRVSGGGGDGEGGGEEPTAARFDRRLGGIVASLEGWCGDAQREVETARRRRQRKPTPQEETYWALETYRGVEYRTAAAELGWDPTRLYRLRRDNGYEPRHGEPKAA